jgi:hypothetical protein
MLKFTSYACAAIIVLNGTLICRTFADCGRQQDLNGQEMVTLSLKEYGVEVRVPASWKLVAKADEAMVFGFSVPNEMKGFEAGVKCEIGPAPETLDEYRTRIDRRAERQQTREVSLKRNATVATDSGEWLETEWSYNPPDRPVLHDFEIRLVAHGQLYTFTLRAVDPVLETLLPQLKSLIRNAIFSPPDTGLELTSEGYCVQKKFRFGLKLPDGWRPSFPLSNESLFWATGKPKGIWNDNLLVIASKAQPLDLEALAETLPDRLRQEDPQCTVKLCKRVTQGKSGDALETVVETQRGPFRITVLERRYTGHRYNYEIKFTVSSEVFEESGDKLRRSADSFVEFVGPQDAKSGAI